jgi:hypothetical protein
VTAAPQVRALAKRHVEALLANYDDDPVGALTVALRTLFGVPHAAFDELVTMAGFDQVRRGALLAHDPAALDALAGELNEVRTLR